MRLGPLAITLALGLMNGTEADDRLAAAPSDWPMLGHDAARSGATTAEIRPPFERAWYRLFPDEGLNTGLQPVIARGRVYLGTLRGILHAIDARTGEDVWTYRAGGAILHAAAVADGKVFFGVADGTLLALNTDDGSVAWTLTTGRPIWNAPAVHKGLVLIGSRDGTLSAAEVGSGKLRWAASTQGPLLGSPAIDTRAGRVYIGSEDMHVHAFDLDTGRSLWRSPKLPGVSFRGYHPVIAPDGSVMITVTPCAGSDAIQQVLLDMVKDVFGDFASWRHTKEENERLRDANFALMEKPETYRRQIDYLRSRLANEPALQTFFVLDPVTGTPRFVTPIVYAESMNGPGAPPVVSADGKVIVKYSALLRSRYEHYSPFLNVGQLNTATGDITPLMDQSRTYGWHDSLLLVHDEQSQLAVGGRVLFNTHQDNVNALDLETLQGYPFPLARNVHEVRPGIAASLWAMILHGKPLPRGWEWLARGTAVYGGGSTIDAPIAIAGDSFYYLPTHEISAGAALIAYRMQDGGKGSEKGIEPAEPLTPGDGEAIRGLMWDWDTLEMPRLNHALAGLLETRPGTRRRPLSSEAREAVDRIDEARLDKVIDEPALGQARPDGHPKVRADLARAVEELIGTRWQPLLFPAAKAPAEAYRLFVDPTETLYTLALAYPELPADLQHRVQAQVRSMMADDGPLAGPTGRKVHDPHAGAVRSAYDPAPERLLHIIDDVTRTETARLYPLWLWAHVTGDWAKLRSDWPRLKERIQAERPNDEPDLGNGWISGLLAACRIAHKLGDEDAERTLRAQARAALRDRLIDELAHTEGGLITRAGTRTILGRWHHLSPDLALALRTFAGPIHRHLMAVYVDHHRPTWWLAWDVERHWRNEAPFSFPSMSGDIFAARALILGEPSERLERFVDLPWCRGDESYIQKLALLLWCDDRAPVR
jgi:hypothetical protein